MGGRMYRGKGFTLIELMVVIAVMAIIAMMATPSFNALLLKQNMNKSARALACYFVRSPVQRDFGNTAKSQ